MKKRINTLKKMSRSNVKARVWLEKNNHKNIYFAPHTLIVKDINFDDLSFDGLCSYETQIVLFQVKSNYKIPKLLKEKYSRVSKKYGIICMWINVIDRVGVSVWS